MSTEEAGPADTKGPDNPGHSSRNIQLIVIFQDQIAKQQSGMSRGLKDVKRVFLGVHNLEYISIETFVEKIMYHKRNF